MNLYKYNKNKFYTFSKKSFFLKYLKNKGYIKSEQDNNKLEPINLKDILDEKNIKITFYDIFIDWLYFRKAYYFQKPEYEPIVEKKLPFEKKDLTFKLFIKSLFMDYYFSAVTKYFIYALIFILYLSYRINSAESRNKKSIEKLTLNIKDESLSEKENYLYFKK